MNFSQAKAPTRRHFCLCCLAAPFAATGVWLTPSEVFAQARAIVLFIKSDAKSADIIVHPLRGNIFVLEGSGGNIAAAAGKEGKLLVDAGIGVSRPRIFAALQALGPAPVKTLSIPIGTSTIPTAMNGSIRSAPKSSRMKIL